MPIAALAALILSPITTTSLLAQMVDLDALAHRPTPRYRTMQASSYDRRSVAPDKPDWFANDDSGKYIRDEVNGGRREHVMADIQGPGSVVRVWSANPTGTIRFYFDGEPEPRIQAKFADLLAGKVAPFSDPFAYEAAHGHDLYFPIPFAKSLKVTLDDDPPGAAHVYYHIGYRVYEPGTPVQTFDPRTIDPHVEAKVAAILDRPFRLSAAKPPTMASQWRIPPGGQASFDLDPVSPSAITSLSFRPVAANAAAWNDPSADRALLRNLLIEIDFDGESCVRVPLGDFFATTPGLHPYDSLPVQVTDSGELLSRWVMPFARTARIRLRNVGFREALVAAAVRVEPHAWDDGTYLFHAQWKPEVGFSRPMRDMHFIKLKGEGRLVGVSQAVGNPTGAWWGEGDEKVYLDGETFPSTFGTGTEDYFGYAWASNIEFSRPYHGQPYAQGPMSFGYSTQHRWHLFDSFPFQSSIRFDLELWHWAEVNYACWGTTFWYARPGGTPPIPIDESRLGLREYRFPRAEGVIEGETMKVLSVTAGKATPQDGFMECSGLSQLWWHEGQKPGERLTLELPCPRTATYMVTAHLCLHDDYGRHELFLDGVSLGVFDFYNPDLKWRTYSFGQKHLTAGSHRLEVVCLTPNPKADPDGNMFGLDYVKLEPTPGGKQ